MIPTTVLFFALNALALAAPHTGKRACNAKNNNGTLAISASASATSLDAVVALAQSSGRKTRTRYHTTTVSAHVSSAVHTTSSAIHTTSIAPIHSSSAVVVHSSAAHVSSITPPKSSSITPPKSTSVAKSSAAAPTSTSTTGKPTLPANSNVGIGFNSNSGSNLNSFITAPGSKLSWYTGWGFDPSTVPGASSLEFVPEVWGATSGAGVVAASKTWPASTKVVLSFNEPNQGSGVGGSNISPSDAVGLHNTWVNDLKAAGKNYLIGAPAISRVDPNDNNNWLDQWIKLCNGACEYDFVPFHFYGTSAADLITYSDKFYEKYQKPLWIIELACWDFSTGEICTEPQVEAFMKIATDHFYGAGKGKVVRWAWYGAWNDMASGGNANGIEDTTGAANKQGKYYVSL